MSHEQAKRIVKRYSGAFKQKVVSEIETGQLSVRQAQKLYRSSGCGTIERWIEQLGKNHLLAQRRYPILSHTDSRQIAPEVASQYQKQPSQRVIPCGSGCGLGISILSIVQPSFGFRR